MLVREKKQERQFETSEELFVDNFLNGTNEFRPVIKKLPGDAGARSYSRVYAQKMSYILMSYPDYNSEFEQFISVRDLLSQLQLKVPDIIEIDRDRSIMLLQDYGDTSIKSHTSNMSEQQKFQLYKHLIDLLIHMQMGQLKSRQFLKISDETKWLEGINLFCEWYLPYSHKIIDNDIQSQFKDIWINLLSKVSFDKLYLTHGDFHSENMMVLDTNIKSFDDIGILDFQDASMSHGLFDLASLLEDARLEISKNNKDLLLKYFYQNHPDFDKIPYDQVNSEFNIISACRHLRILGIFSRKYLRDNDAKYLQYMPYILNYLRENLRDKSLSNLKDFFSDKIRIFEVKND